MSPQMTGCLLLLSLAGILATAAAAAPSRGPVRAEIRKEGDTFRLYRGGRPYYIKGAVYWAHPTGRFPLSGLVAAGGNSVRCGGRNVDLILDEAARLGVSVVVSLPMRMEAVHKFDYSDKQAVAAQLERIKAKVDKYKGHPALLMWGIGNELSMFYKNKAVWPAVNDVARYIKKVDGRHPTMTVIGSSLPYEQVTADIRKGCPEIDLLGINHYGGLETVPGKIARCGWDRPYCVTEWGPTGHWQVPKTRWKCPIEETSTEKAAVYRSRYEGTMKKDTQRCLGSYVFFWQSKQERTHTWYGMFLAGGQRTEAVGVMQQMWTGSRPANRAPRVERPRIDGKAASDNVYLEPGTKHVGQIKATDADGERLTYRWQILPEPKKFGYGGMGERKPKPLPDLLGEAAGGRIEFAAPAAEGAYRLFVDVLDTHANAATANIPFYVRP